MCVQPIRTLYLLILTNQLAQFIITSFPNFPIFRIIGFRNGIPQVGFLGVCLGCDESMFGDVRFTMFAWGFDTFLLGDEFFEWCAWGCGFQGLVCLGTSISAPLLLGDLLGVDLLGSVRQGCI